jgi:hypothetical protein
LRTNFDNAATGVIIRVRLTDLAPLYNPSKFGRACKVVRNWATFFANKAPSYMAEVGEENPAEKYPLYR